jgi:hypothetical protein
MTLGFGGGSFEVAAGARVVLDNTRLGSAAFDVIDATLIFSGEANFINPLPAFDVSYGGQIIDLVDTIPSSPSCSTGGVGYVDGSFACQ